MTRAAVMLTLALATSACAPRSVPIPASMSAEAQVAARARQVIAAANGALTAVDALASRGLVRQEDAVVVFGALAQVGAYGQQLAAVLRVVDTATGTDRADGLTRASMILVDIRRLVDGLPIAGDAKARVDAALAPIADAVTSLQAVLTGGR